MNRKPSMGRKPTLRNALLARMQGGATTVPKMCEALGRSPGAVQSAMTRLEAMGLVRRKGCDMSNKRPAYLFELTDAAASFFVRDSLGVAA